MNRMGASRLQSASRALEVPVEFFFRDAPQFDGSQAPPAVVGSADGKADGNFVADFLSLQRGDPSSTRPSCASRTASFDGASSSWSGPPPASTTSTPTGWSGQGTDRQSARLILALCRGRTLALAG